MAEVVPTILTNDPHEYRAQVEAFNGFAKRVQIDVTDGKVATNQTVPLNTVWWPKGWTVDLHLMVAQPEQYIDTLLQLKPSLVIFHAETEADLVPIFQKLHQAGIKVGVALQKSTFPGHVGNAIKLSDHVLIFAGELGQQGGEADMLQIEKVPLIRALKHSVEIGWDGGVNISNIRALAHADIDVLNVGKAISSATDKAAAYKQLVAEADKKGVRL